MLRFSASRRSRSATVNLLLLRYGCGAAEGVPAAVELTLGVVVSAPGAADDASHAPPSAGLGVGVLGGGYVPVLTPSSVSRLMCAEGVVVVVAWG